MNEKKPPRLKRCPFCHKPGTYNRETPEWAIAMWSAGCDFGHARSPDFETKQEAADWWNRRGPKV